MYVHICVYVKKRNLCGLEKRQSEPANKLEPKKKKPKRNICM